MRKTPTKSVMLVIALALSPAFMACANVSKSWVGEIKSPQYFALYVEDLDRSVEWYCTVFGLAKLGGSQAEDGAWRIANVGSDELMVEIIRDSRAQSVDRAFGFRKVGFYVSDIDAVAQRIKAETGEEVPIFDFAELNQRFVQLHDPEGNRVQIFASQSSR